ncbi:MAG: alpha/beta hydrolase [Verrucomicrobia bacterium]|nr:alpha/beta hydrolase [Verrucomicrobiota bacterium]
MKLRRLHRSVLWSALLAAVTVADAAPGPVALWPGPAPGDTATLPPERDTTKPTDRAVAGRSVQRIGNVAAPSITLFPAPAAGNTGAAVLVCPGGGYNILALDLEGTEVCAWLNSIGVTGVLLKYRVPKRPGTEKHGPPLQDAQRALGLVRQRAGEFGIDPARIGVLGFSAGGHLAAVLSNQHGSRSYPRVDAADDVSCRPDFTVLIYPAYLTVKEQNEAVAPELPVSKGNTPPTFIAMTEDDTVRVETGLFYYLALKKAGVAAEMHLYPKGGHGYGLRRTELDVTSWPDRVGDWLKSAGWLKPAK